MTPAELDLRRYAALGLVAEAGAWRSTISAASESLGITMKGAQDWLTVADGAVEDFLRARLAELFPGDSVIGEEGGGEASDAVWILDPIDGTVELRPWRPQLVHLDRLPAATASRRSAIVAAPALDELYVAQRGRGATLNGAADRGLRRRRHRAAPTSSWAGRPACPRSAIST